MWLETKLLFIVAYLSNAINCDSLFNQNINELKHNLLNNNVDNDKLKGLNRVLVKRVVPHGSESNGVEYDKKLNYLYKPLVRLHVQKPVNDVSLAEDEQQNGKLFKLVQLKDLDNLGQNLQRVNSGKNKRLEIYKESNQYGDGVSELLNLLEGENDKKDDGKDDQRVNSKRKSDEFKLLLKLLNADEENDDIRKYSKFKRITRELLDAMYGEKSKSKKEYWDKMKAKMEAYTEKKDFYKNLINTFTQVLRHGDDREDEPQPVFSLKGEATSMTEKPKMALPIYPYWNWWTYKKNLYHDNCRHGWVRFHNMCYELPPH